MEVYYGFGYLIGIGDTNNKESIRIASSAFYTFIISIMKLKKIIKKRLVKRFFVIF